MNVPFEALEIFLPHRPRDGQTGATLEGPWDWNLFLVGCVCFVESIAGVSCGCISRFPVHDPRHRTIPNICSNTSSEYWDGIPMM